MKLPYIDRDVFMKLQHAFNEAAITVTVEIGLLVTVGTEWSEKGQPIRLFFKVDGREYECLNDVRKLYNLKAFL